MVKIIKKIDLSAKNSSSKIEKPDVKYTNEWITSQSFSQGAEAYILAFKEKEKYETWYSPTDSSYVDDKWIHTPYDSIVSYIEGNSNVGSFEIDFHSSVGVYFERNKDGQDFYSSSVIDSTGEKVSTLKEGEHGNLVTFESLNDATTPATVPTPSIGDTTLRFDFKQKVVGSWKVVKLPNSDSLAILTKVKNKDEQELITLIDGKVYIGSYTKAMEEFELNEELNLNEVAFTDLMEVIKK